MICVTPADLGRPIAAIVERCGAPDSVMSIWTLNQLLYVDVANGHAATVYFDADQMRARVIQFMANPPAPAKQSVDWTMTLPFESGARDIVLGKTTLATAQNELAADADVTTQGGAAFRSAPHSDVVLMHSTSDRALNTAFVGERTALMQMEIIAPPINTRTLDYMTPLLRDRKLRLGTGQTGSRTTIFRIDVDAAGVARTVTIVIPSGDAAFDEATQQRLSTEAYRPGTLDQKPVSGAIFVQVRH